MVCHDFLWSLNEHNDMENNIVIDPHLVTIKIDFLELGYVTTSTFHVTYEGHEGTVPWKLPHYA